MSMEFSKFTPRFSSNWISFRDERIFLTAFVRVFLDKLKIARQVNLPYFYQRTASNAMSCRFWGMHVLQFRDF